MPDLASLIAFAAIALGMVLTPGPNMVYLVSRSISQGRTAGLISLGGVALGFVFYMLCAAFGITAFVMAGSCDCYDHAVDWETGLTPQTPFRATNPYAITKVMATQLAQCYRRQHGMRLSVAIFFNQYSGRAKCCWRRAERSAVTPAWSQRFSQA